MNALVFRRVAAAFVLGTRSRRALALGLGVCLAAVFLGRLLPSRDAARAVTGVGLVAEVGLLIAGLLFLLERGLVVLGERVPRVRAVVASAPPVEMAAVNPALPALSRRELLSRASATAVLAFGGGSAAYAGIRGRHDYALEEVPLRLARLPRRLDGFTIAQLSDLHFGLFLGDWEVARAMELVKRAKPDLIAITGDMVDHDPAFAEELGRFVRRLTGVAPVVAVPGNHDHYAGVERVLAAVRQGGGTVLANEATRVAEDRIVVAGVDDLWARRLRLGRGPDLDAALLGHEDDAPRILLAHQPAFFDEASTRIDLQLSGHTHGGQFNLGVRPADYVLPHGWVAGRYVRGEAQLYVNRGFGTAGPPARLGAPPEVTRLVLTV